MNMFATTKIVSNEQLAAEKAYRKQLISSGQLEDPAVKKLNAIEAINSIGDTKMKRFVYDLAVKAVESYDLTGIRFVSYFDETSVYANNQTVYTDIIRKNGIVKSRDFQVAWREEYANASANAVEFFNLNAGLPQESEMARAIDSNTMGAFGNQINIPIITSELHAQSPINPGNEYADQLRMLFVRMERFANAKRLVNTEVTSEIVGDTPQWGGIVTRTTANRTVLPSAQDLTAALIQTVVNTVANATSVDGLGFGVPLVCLTTVSQVENAYDLMNDRFAGETSVAFRDTQAMLQALVPGSNLPADMVNFYKPKVGRPIAFVYEPQLTDGMAFFFDPNQPMIVKFEMMGQLGPWTLELPSMDVRRQYAVFDFQSQVDRKRASRYIYLNVL